MRECSRSATLGPWLLGGQAVTKPVRAGVGPLALFTQRVVRQLHYLVKTFLVGQSQMLFVMWEPVESKSATTFVPSAHGYHAAALWPL